MAKGSGGTRGASGGGTLSKERIQQIYHGAVTVFGDAVTAYKNWANDDPNTSMKDAFAKIDRAKKAYEWAKANGKGQDFVNAAKAKISKTGFSDAAVQAQSVFDMVVNNKYD